MKNKTLISFARETLKKLLDECTQEQCDLFTRMYSYKNLTLPINEVVDRMDVDKLDHALTQVEASVFNNNKKLEDKYR